ncbi:MAG: response regulator [Calditrichaeota bacterium]|nr:MAG: response regulator [Calditrichota bacterium]
MRGFFRIRFGAQGLWLGVWPRLRARQPSIGEKAKRPCGRILIMDDEPMLRKLSAEFLSKLGYDVTTAASGEEAVELYRMAGAKNQPFDAVIMDLRVPGGMGGKEAIEKLKALDPHIKAIISSASSEDPVLTNYKRYGFSAAVNKPFNLHDLQQALQSVHN